MQKRWPVGLGPSGKTWPRWASQRAHSTSVRVEKNDESSKVASAPSATGLVKLGQPVPDSNLSAEENSGSPQQTQAYVPSM